VLHNPPRARDRSLKPPHLTSTTSGQPLIRLFGLLWTLAKPLHPKARGAYNPLWNSPMESDSWRCWERKWRRRWAFDRYRSRAMAPRRRLVDVLSCSPTLRKAPQTLLRLAPARVGTPVATRPPRDPQTSRSTLTSKSSNTIRLNPGAVWFRFLSTFLSVYGCRVGQG